MSRIANKLSIFDNEKKTIQKKIDDYISKVNNISKKNLIDDNNLELQDADILETDIHMNTELLDIEGLKKTMIHSIDMFDTNCKNTIQTEYWDCKLDINSITELCLRYNIHSEYILDGRNGIINLWNNKIKLK